MRRREFLTLAGAAGAAATLPRVALGQQAKVPRVAWMTIPLSPIFLQALREGLADNGYVDGKDVIVEVYTPRTYAEFPAFLSKVIPTEPSVIVTYGTPGSAAVKAATSAIPLVFLNSTDPVGAGLVSNLAHPGGNVTGTGGLGPDIVGRQMALIKEAVPKLSRCAVPIFRADPVTSLYIPQVQAAAVSLGIEPLFINLVEGQDYVRQLDQVWTSGAEAACHPAYTELASFFDSLFDAYLAHRFPVMCGNALQKGASTPFYGVLQFFSDNEGNVRTRGAAAVAAVLRGTKPGDLPIERPTLFDVGVNLDMAQKIGVTIPQSILAQSTYVIDYDIRAPKH